MNTRSALGAGVMTADHIEASPTPRAARNGNWVVIIAVIVGAAMICATLLALNLRTLYPMTDSAVQANYLQLLQRGCTPQYLPGPPPIPYSVSCPLWVRL